LAGDPAPHHPPNVHENGNGRTITQQELNKYDRIILVVALDHSIEYQQQTAGQFELMYHRIDDLSINNIVIRVYESSQSTQ
jgi:molybdopterin synthase catalytic subunit